MSRIHLIKLGVLSVFLWMQDLNGVVFQDFDWYFLGWVVLFLDLGYKAFNEKFKTAFLKNISKTKDKQYKIVKKTDNSAFYCSQYVWYLYWKTAKDLGYETVEFKEFF